MTAIPTENAEIRSPDGRHVWLVASGCGASACFVLLRPDRNGRVARRCQSLAEALGCGRVLIVHLFARDAEDMADLVSEADPVGEHTNDWILAASRLVVAEGGPVVCAWGTGGSFMDRDRSVLTLLDAEGIPVQCLGTDRFGFPTTPARGGSPRPYGGRPDE